MTVSLSVADSVPLSVCALVNNSILLHLRLIPRRPKTHPKTPMNTVTESSSSSSPSCTYSSSHYSRSPPTTLARPTPIPQAALRFASPLVRSAVPMKYFVPLMFSYSLQQIIIISTFHTYQILPTANVLPPSSTDLALRPNLPLLLLQTAPLRLTAP